MRRPRRRRTGLLDNKSGSFGFDNWSLEAREKFEGLLDDMIQEGLAIATKEYKCDAYLHGADLVVTVPVGAYEFEGPQWRFVLADMIRDQIECAGGFDKEIDPEAREELTEISATLRVLTDELDKALKVKE
jgi:hypothetical protein